MLVKATDMAGKQAQARLDSPTVDYQPPSDGPFRCDHCPWFDAGGGQGKGDQPNDPNEPTESHCEHPKVLALVKPGGCCKRFDDTEEEAKR